MEEVLIATKGIFNVAFYVVFLVTFYLSIKKCFLKDGKRRLKLALITLLTEPYMAFAISIFFSIVIVTFVFVFLGYDLSTVINMFKGFDSEHSSTPVADEWRFTTVVIFSVMGIIYTVLVLLFSCIVGKWLKTHHVSLVTYVYLMYAVVLGLSDNKSVNSIVSTRFQYSMILMNSLALIVALLLIYNLIIKELAKMTDNTIVVNRRIFVVPPVIFLLFYYPVDYCVFEFAGYEPHMIAQVFSIVILFLFIWAFYTIINNINATNDAVVAKNETKELSVEVMEALANTIDAKDKYTNGHSIRVAQYSRMICEKMGLPKEKCENIYYMGLLHDIGKIGVPNEIINKPARLSDEEYEIIKTHPIIGYEILSKIKSKPELLKGARWHHERYDGKGYPDKISGEDIPLEARIIAIADAYDAMTSNRSYRKYLSQDVVRQEIEKNSGTQFDPELAKYMLKIIDEDTDYIYHE